VALLLVLALTYGPYRVAAIDMLDIVVFRVEVAIWPDVTRTVELRLEGVTAPRHDSPCESERLLAAEARDFTRAFVDQPLTLSAVRKSTRGDWVIGRLKDQRGADLGTALVEAGYAARLKKDGRPSWCPQSPGSGPK
jgi:endonuclease YncB( thermonuclease family)